MNSSEIYRISILLLLLMIVLFSNNIERLRKNKHSVLLLELFMGGFFFNQQNICERSRSCFMTLPGSTKFLLSKLWRLWPLSPMVHERIWMHKALEHTNCLRDHASRPPLYIPRDYPSLYFFYLRRYSLTFEVLILSTSPGHDL